MAYTNSGLAHAFASGNAGSGATPNGNFYFTGPTLFSYGSHFPIAHRMTLEDGSSITLINADSYSSSTSQHQTLAHRAIHGPTKSLPDLEDVMQIASDTRRAKQKGSNPFAQEHAARLAKYCEARLKEAECADTAIGRARSENGRALQQTIATQARTAAVFVWTEIAGRRGDPFTGSKRLTTTARNATEKAAFARIERRANECLDVLVSHKIDALNRALIEAARSDNAIPGESHEIIHQSRVMSRARETLTSGLTAPAPVTGITMAIYRRVIGVSELERVSALVSRAQMHLSPILSAIDDAEVQVAKECREASQDKVDDWLSGGPLHRVLNRLPVLCRVMGETVETSHGADVPLEHAIAVTRLAARIRRTGKAWQGSHRVGLHTVTSISAQGDMRIGCHLIAWAAIAECVATFRPDLTAELNLASPQLADA